MYCPRCGAENLSEASFCRACGADISLVPQALTGHLPATRSDSKESAAAAKRRVNKDEGAYETFFLGLAFLLIVLGGAIFFRGGFMIWIWFIIPAFACIGSGVGKYMRAKHEREMLRAALPTPLAPIAPRTPLAEPYAAAHHLPARDTAEIVASFEASPSSVTEGTTRLLDETPATPNARAATPESERRS